MIKWSKDMGQEDPVFLPGESLAGYSPWGCKELDTNSLGSQSTETA